MAVSMPVASADGHVVADDVVTPLGFAFGDDGTLYVAEAFTGALTAFKSGERTTLVAGEPGTGTAGVDAAGRGKVVYTQTLPPEVGGSADTTLNRVQPNGKITTLASLLAYETDNNPDQINTYGVLDPSPECAVQAEAAAEVIGPISNPGLVDSNPYAVALDEDGSTVVADAGGNDLVRVSPNGKRVTTIAVLPPIEQTLTAEVLAGFPVDLSACEGEAIQSDPVPTDVEIGPDGHYYVSALPGFPESPGAGTVFRVDHTTGAVTEVATGFTGTVDIAVADDGTLYVAELFAFQVSRIEPGADTASASAFVNCPTAVEIGPDNGLYVAEGGGLCTGEEVAGRIVKLDL
jgi:sugar lactone lactonase YvrE